MFCFRKALITSIYITISIAVLGQTQKGDSYRVGYLGLGAGNLERAGSNSYKAEYYTPSLSISECYFFKDNIAFQWSLGGYYYSLKETVSKSMAEQIGYSFNPTGSFKYFTGSNRWRVFIGGGISLKKNWVNYKYSAQTNNTTTNSSSNTLYIRPVFEAGGVYFLNQRWAFKASFLSSISSITPSVIDLGILYWPNSMAEGANLTTALQKGNYMLNIGGKFIEYNSKRDTVLFNYKDKNVTIGIGRFVKDRLLIGLTASYATVQVPEISSFSKGDNSHSSWSLGLYLKKYLSTNRFTPYYILNLNYRQDDSEGKVTIISDYSTIDLGQGFVLSGQNIGFSVNLRGGVGVAYSLSNHFIVESELANLQFLSVVNDDKIQTSVRSFNLSASLTPQFSLCYVFE